MNPKYALLLALVGFGMVGGGVEAAAIFNHVDVGVNGLFSTVLAGFGLVMTWLSQSSTKVEEAKAEYEALKVELQEQYAETKAQAEQLETAITLAKKLST